MLAPGGAHATWLDAAPGNRAEIARAAAAARDALIRRSAPDRIAGPGALRRSRRSLPTLLARPIRNIVVLADSTTGTRSVGSPAE